MIIKILGTGCAKCKATEEVVKTIAKELNLSPLIQKVEDMQEIMKYNIMSTPALVIDEIVKIKGRVPTPNEVRELLTLK
jgi:small redox-active disulfide protein 2